MSARSAARRPRTLARVLFSPWSTAVAIGILTLSFVLPADGFGVPLCWFKAATGLPCIGCGLTRSVTALSHLHLGEALRFHPFGPLVYALSALLVGLLVAGRARRTRLARWLTRRDAVLRPAYLGTVAAFIAFGVARLFVALVEPTLTAHL